MFNWIIVSYLLIVQWVHANDLGFSLFDKRALSSQNPFGYPIGCSPQSTNVIPGLTMELYSYPIVSGTPPNCYDASYVDPEYPRTGYLKRKMIGKSTGVTGSLNYKFSVEKACMVKYGNLPAGYNYNEPLTVSNFTMLLYGYFKPQTSGIHTFFVNADDLLYINFGAGNAFDCCKREDSKYKLGEYVAYDIWHVDSSKNKVSLNLEKDVYYPIRMFFNNIGKDSSLDLSFSVNGAVEHITDFSGYLYSVPDQPDACPAPIGYDTTCRSIDSTTTYSTQFITTKPVENVLPITSTIYYIATPCAKTPSPDPKPEDPKPEDPKPEDPKPEDPKPEDPKPEDPKPEDPKPEDPKPEDPKPEDPKPEDPKPEDPKPEDPKPEKPIDPKPEEPSHNPSSVNPSSVNPSSKPVDPSPADPSHNPSSVNPSSVNPSSVNPSSVNPSSVNPSSKPVDPSPADPSHNPSSVNPSSVNPSSVNPSSVNPSSKPVDPSPADPSHNPS
ncbi:Protein piccolo, partial [Nakaseomyces glabratus]